jgi:D-psicose/D-tagatose/L-ribulose 3-epimerase
MVMNNSCYFYIDVWDRIEKNRRLKLKIRDNVTFPLCLQIWDTDFKSSNFTKMLQILCQEHFFGVELNLTSFDISEIEVLLELLRSYNLRLTGIATGAWAKKNDYSFSSEDENARKASVKAFIEQVLAAAAFAKTKVIVGTLKGAVQIDKQKQLQSFFRSLCEIDAVNKKMKVPVYLEATNHYESCAANTVSDTVEVIKKLHGEGRYFVLPDTYHMNMEETNFFIPVLKNRNYFTNIHMSDNNRCFPGYGMLRFGEVYSALKAADYQGTVTIEGRIQNDFDEEIRNSAAFLRCTAMNFC